MAIWISRDRCHAIFEAQQGQSHRVQCWNPVSVARRNSACRLIDTGMGASECPPGPTPMRHFPHPRCELEPEICRRIALSLCLCRRRSSYSRRGVEELSAFLSRLGPPGAATGRVSASGFTPRLGACESSCRQRPEPSGPAGHSRCVHATPTLVRDAALRGLCRGRTACGQSAHSRCGDASCVGVERPYPQQSQVERLYWT